MKPVSRTHNYSFSAGRLIFQMPTTHPSLRVVNKARGVEMQSVTLELRTPRNSSIGREVDSSIGTSNKPSSLFISKKDIVHIRSFSIQQNRFPILTAICCLENCATATGYPAKIIINKHAAVQTANPFLFCLGD